jgi:low affinity Fe/Cu permease
MRPTKSRSWFTRFAKRTALITGRPSTFLLAAAVILVWAITGPLFHFSDTWQLVINTGTTVVTFLMVFLIQSTQNRDAEATQVKLDELIRAVGHARNELLDLEELEETDLDELRQTYLEMAKRARGEIAEKRKAIRETSRTREEGSPESEARSGGPRPRRRQERHRGSEAPRD